MSTRPAHPAAASPVASPVAPPEQSTPKCRRTGAGGCPTGSGPGPAGTWARRPARRPAHGADRGATSRAPVGVAPHRGDAGARAVQVPARPRAPGPHRCRRGSGPGAVDRAPARSGQAGARRRVRRRSRGVPGPRPGGDCALAARAPALGAGRRSVQRDPLGASSRRAGKRRPATTHGDDQSRPPPTGPGGRPAPPVGGARPASRRRRRPDPLLALHRGPATTPRRRSSPLTAKGAEGQCGRWAENVAEPPDARRRPCSPRCARSR